ncbi:MAG: glutathione S-transferase [Rhodobacteraceae bacterium]|nr:glutathione S-transferase [Paracoccaceae bacterium]
MANYTLYYHPIPFRGQFIRWVLAHAGADWDEPAHGEVLGLKSLSVTDQPVPFMAPPLLVDHDAGLSLAQMPAILTYLGQKHGAMPDDPARAALTGKVIADANDVLDEMTRYGGRSMWTQVAWDGFAADRLPRWMQIFEETGRRHGLSRQTGFLLGGDAPGLADLVTGCLWFTMTSKLPVLQPMLARHAPAVAALSTRMAGRPPVAALRARTDAALGDTWCGGQIEASLRRVLGGMKTGKRMRA